MGFCCSLGESHFPWCPWWEGFRRTPAPLAEGLTWPQRIKSRKLLSIIFGRQASPTHTWERA